jgi:hydrocephalus-inducing protein
MPLPQVTFKSEESGEYLYYNITFKSTPPGIIGTIDLTSQVRKGVSHVISITNPLTGAVTMTASSNVTDIALPANFIIGAQSEGKCMFEYLPLKVGQVTGKVTLQSSDLGSYQYEVRLTATPCPQEKPIHFTTSLGSSQQHTCRFVSFSRGRTEYTCKVSRCMRLLHL